MKNILYLTAIFVGYMFFASVNYSFASEQVGYINILGGLPPEKAFTIERGGQKITPSDVQTDVHFGDVVVPSDGIHLLFVPNDALCDEVEITSSLKITKCPKPEVGMEKMAYDLIAGQFMAAPVESVAMYSTRGNDDDRVYTLLRKTLFLFINISSPQLREKVYDAIKNMPFIGFVNNQNDADVILSQNDCDHVSLRKSDGYDIGSYNISSAHRNLRVTLNNLINFKTISKFQKNTSQCKIECLIDIFKQSDKSSVGSMQYDDKIWIEDDKLVFSKASIQKKYSDERLLSFSIKNNSSSDCYIYIINYTNDGQILNVLPSEIYNKVKAGEALSFPSVKLIVGSPEEAILFISSKNKLDLSYLEQDDFKTNKNKTVLNESLRPARETNLESILAVFNFSSN